MKELLLRHISQIIIEYAKRNEVIEYNQISKSLKGAISPVQLNKPLGEISQRCINLGFPPLSAIVVNHDTRLPGEGFFTWVAAQMGYSNLIPSKWEEFYYEQEQKVFNCTNWETFLTDAFSINMKSPTKDIHSISTADLLSDYLSWKRNRTKYCILIIKNFQKGNQQELHRYQVLVLGNEKLIDQATVEHMDNQLFESTKRKGIQLLLAHALNVSTKGVTMAHYTLDGQAKRIWKEESLDSLDLLLKEERQAALKNIAYDDIEAEASQEDIFYKDGNMTNFYGTRYERNAFNRARAIEIHGAVCKACGFDFEKTYGEHGRGFIEVHHIHPVSLLKEETVIDPANDLIPLCSNCHRMIHRKKGEVLDVDKLKAIYKSSYSYIKE